MFDNRIYTGFPIRKLVSWVSIRLFLDKSCCKLALEIAIELERYINKLFGCKAAKAKKGVLKLTKLREEFLTACKASPSMRIVIDKGGSAKEIAKRII